MNPITSNRYFWHQLLGLTLLCSTFDALGDSPAPQEPYTKQVGDPAQYVFVMLPGYWEEQGRSVEVPCADYDTYWEARRQRATAKLESDLSRFCGDDERLDPGGKHAGKCFTDCLSRRWAIWRRGQTAIGIKYPASGLYPSDGSLTPLWTVEWYAHEVHLSPDGRFLVRMGPWASSPKQLAVAFYERGTLLKEYTVEDLVADPGSLPHSVSHFRWKDNVSFNEENGQLLITTLNDEVYVIDITTGETLIAKRLPKPSYKASITTHDGDSTLLSNIEICPSVWVRIQQILGGRSASAAFHGYLAGNSGTLESGHEWRSRKSHAFPFRAVRTIHHIGHDVDGERDIWLIQPKSGKAVTLLTDRDSFAFCGEARGQVSKNIAAREIKTVVFE